MSLLIDALKQAELTRQQAEAENADQLAFALEPLPTAETEADMTAPEPVPTAPPSVTARPPEKTSAREAIRQQAARELFEVKQPAPSRLPLVVAIIALCLMIPSGLYLWWNLQPRGLQPGPALARPIGPTPTPQAVSPSPAEPVRMTPHSVPTVQNEAAGEGVPAPTRPIVRSPVQSRSQGATLELRDGTADQVVAPATVTIRRGGPTERDTPLTQSLQAAYAALTRGELPQARSLYQEVLRNRPRNLDALNGLARIALKEGDARTAEAHLRTALEADPSDAQAQAQLLQMLAAASMPEAEARARELIAAQPQSAAAHFALGNLLGRQARWGEAQQAYFQAYTLDPDNPDVLFNLAVSLEHVGQSPLARQFYAQAAQAAQQRPAAFSPAQASQRADALMAPR